MKKVKKLNKLKELINKLCPNGVEYKKLEDCCNILDNERKPVTKSARIKGEYPYYGANGIQDYVSDYIFDGTFVLVGEDGSVINKNGNPVVTWAEGKIWVNNHAHVIKEKENVLLRYLYHYIQTINVSVLIHGNIPKLNQGDFRNLRIAVPPLKVQCEIVHILDDFTLLSAELSAELEARQKQYEYYMDKIFNNATQTKMVKLSDVLVSLKTGLNPRKFFQLNTPDANGYYVTVRELGDRNVRYWESKDRINQIGLSRINERSNLEINDVLFSGTGTIGRVSIIEKKPEDWNVKEGVYILKPKIDLINPVFLMYLMKSNYMRNIYSNYIVGSPVSSVPMKDLKNVEFDLPSIEEQEKIVRILDRFDQLCTDISEGLPAEIEARQKQYEYYRDKLLTFKELKVNE